MTTHHRRIEALASHASAALGIDICVTGHRAHYWADETRAAYWLTRQDLEYASDVLANPDTADDAYSHWCAGTGARQMSVRSQQRIYGR